MMVSLPYLLPLVLLHMLTSHILGFLPYALLHGLPSHKLGKRLTVSLKIMYTLQLL